MQGEPTVSELPGSRRGEQVAKAGRSPQLVDPEAKAAFVEETLGPEPEVRSGPAGLRNLGATCYVSQKFDGAETRQTRSSSSGSTTFPFGMACTAV